jgi:hypothetical protein
MKSAVFSPESVLVVRLERGEEIVSTVLAFAQQQGIRAGSISGIGAISGAVIGFFNPETKAYREIAFSEPLEILSLSGNLSTKDGAPYAHLHASLGRETGEAIGGHLVSAKVSATAELIVQPLNGTLERQFSEEIGLNLLKL